MNDPHPPIALRARYIFPVTAAPIRDGVITIRAGRIESIEAYEVVRANDGPTPLDLGDVAIMPALVNAHTHLEFSDLPKPLGAAGLPIAKWIPQVVGYRRARDAEPVAAHQARVRAIDVGLLESAQAGASHLGEIATPGWPSEPFDTSPIGGVSFLELLGLAESRVEELLQLARAHLQTSPASKPHARWQRGLSPHAPYTVHPKLLAGAIELAKQYDAPLAMHLAESPEEIELLQDGCGPLFEMLKQFGVWQPGVFTQGTRPLDYLRALAQAPRSLVIHGNYLDDEELAFAAQHAERMTVVYCPRTHARFGHAKYPLAKMLARGVRVAVGTDSRASNPDLSLLAELRQIARHHPEVSPADILRMGTLTGAQSLGLHDTGSLSPRQPADLCVAALPASELPTSDPQALLLHHDLPVWGLILSGRWHAGSQPSVEIKGMQ